MRKFIAPGPSQALYLTPSDATFVRETMASATLDDFDRKILAILQRDNRTPQREIGAAVNLSAPAVQRRIRRLEAAGVITGNVAVVAPAAVGRPLTILIEVEMESERPEFLETMKAAFLAAPEVQQCYFVTGQVDIILVVTVPDMAGYEDLTRRLFVGNPNLKIFRTLVVMNALKTGLGVPV